MTNKKKLWISILSLCLIAAVLIGGTLAFLTDSEEKTNTFTIGDLDIILEEPNWDDEVDGKEEVPGDTMIKDPTVTAIEGDGYMRVKMTLIDDNAMMPNPAYTDGNDGEPEFIANTNRGKAITDQARLDKIFQTIYYDASYDVTADPATTNLLPTVSYTLAELAGFTTINGADFTLDAVRSSSAGSVTGVYYYNYNAVFNAADGVTPADVAVLFTNIVIPTDWNQTDLAVLGDYKIELVAQAIQSENFADAAAAFTALDAEIAAGTIQKDYGQIGG